jgi:hypothetical protein
VSGVLRKGLPLSQLTTVEWRLGKSIGEDRNELAIWRDAYQYVEGGDTLTHNIGGARAELAVAKAVNIYPSETLQLGGDRGYDLRLHTGRTIDVKWNPKDVDLVVSQPRAKKPCDFYLLVLGSYFVFGGWATKEQLFVPERLTDLHRKDKEGRPAFAYVVRAKHLLDCFQDRR